MEGTVAAFVLALTALGLALVFGVMRIVNVAHGEFFMLGAVFAWAFAHLAGSPAFGFLMAVVASPIIVGGAAIAIDRLILRRFNYQPEATIVATIGLLYIIQQLALIFYGPDARSVSRRSIFRIEFPWFGYSGYKLVVVGIAAAAAAGDLVRYRTDQARLGHARDGSTARLPRPSAFQSSSTGSTLPCSRWVRCWPPSPAC
ncbi:MAG: hypothetical protein R3D05_09410 [Dongiaceae bacterium]